MRINLIRDMLGWKWSSDNARYIISAPYDGEFRVREFLRTPTHTLDRSLLDVTVRMAEIFQWGVR